MYADGRIVANAPREGEWFAVNLKAINRQLFAERRTDPREESTRQLILEAQRLTNGESWYHVCNGPDANNYHRMITWKNGLARVVGAAQKCGIGFCSATVREEDFDDECTVGATVPKVVKYKT